MGLMTDAPPEVERDPAADLAADPAPGLAPDTVPSDARCSGKLTGMSTPRDDWQRIGRLVKVQRQHLDLRQEDVAQLAGVRRSTVSEVEKGQYQAAPKSLPAILRALGLSAEDLLVDGPVTVPAPGAAPPLAHLSDAQLSNEVMRMVAELASRLAARPVATLVPPRGAYGTLSAIQDPPDDGHHTAR